MKKSSLILAIIFLISMGSLQRIEAQDSRKVEKERQVQEAIDAQKKAMVEQQKAQEDARKALEDQKIVIEKAFKDAPMGQEEREKFDQAMKIFENSKGARNFHSPDPYVIGYGIDFNRRNFGEDTEGTNWEFSKYLKEISFERDYVIDVENSVSNVVMSIVGDCKMGEIRIKINMPNGKTYSDIVIDEFGNLNWRKSFNISETENKDKTGAWTFEIKSSKASGFFKISLQTY
jgi:hypothetical protein